jgi:hypothetical protein
MQIQGTNNTYLHGHIKDFLSHIQDCDGGIRSIDGMSKRIAVSCEISQYVNRKPTRMLALVENNFYLAGLVVKSPKNVREVLVA